MVTSEVPTASYSAIMNNGGELLLCVGDMDIHDHITPDYVSFLSIIFYIFSFTCRSSCDV